MEAAGEQAHRLLRERKSAEYLLLENRQVGEYDGGLPGYGLLVYHVDESVRDDEGDPDVWHPKVRAAAGKWPSSASLLRWELQRC